MAEKSHNANQGGQGETITLLFSMKIATVKLINLSANDFSQIKMTTFIAKWILIYSVLYATYQRKNCPYLDVVTYIENVLGGTAVADEPVSIKERENTFRHGEGARTHKKNIKRDYKTYECNCHEA